MRTVSAADLIVKRWRGWFTWTPRVKQEVEGSVEAEAQRLAVVFVSGVDLQFPRSDDALGRRRHLRHHQHSFNLHNWLIWRAAPLGSAQNSHLKLTDWLFLPLLLLFMAEWRPTYTEPSFKIFSRDSREIMLSLFAFFFFENWFVHVFLLLLFLVLLSFLLLLLL